MPQISITQQEHEHEYDCEEGLEPRGFTPLLSFALQNAKKSSLDTVISPVSNPLRTHFVIVYQITRWVELPSRLWEEVDLHQTDQHPALHKVSLRATDPMIIIAGTFRDYATPLPI
jgi:hypothetical protein